MTCNVFGGMLSLNQSINIDGFFVDFSYWLVFLGCVAEFSVVGYLTKFVLIVGLCIDDGFESLFLLTCQLLSESPLQPQFF